MDKREAWEGKPEAPHKKGKATEGYLARVHMLLGESTEAVAFVGAMRDLLAGAEEGDACFILARGELAIEKACRREYSRGLTDGQRGFRDILRPSKEAV